MVSATVPAADILLLLLSFRFNLTIQVTENGRYCISQFRRFNLYFRGIGGYDVPFSGLMNDAGHPAAPHSV